MSDREGRRSFWGILGLYVAGSWICLQVVDVLGQNINMPSWAFSLTLTMLLIGLPITAASNDLVQPNRTRAGWRHKVSTVDCKDLTVVPAAPRLQTASDPAS